MDQMQNSAKNAKEKDIGTFNKALEILSQDTILEFTSSLLSDNSCTMEYVDMLTQFTRYAENPATRFFDKQVQDYFNNLGESLYQLGDFTEKNFGTKEKSFIFYLSPELKNNNSMVENESWLKQKEELNILTKKFIDNYKIFIKDGSEILFKENGSETNSVDRYWLEKKNNEYYFDGNLVYIKSKDAQYILILDAVYTLKPQGGDLSYENIIRQCKERGIKMLKKNAVQQALTGETANLFKYVSTIKRSPAHGIPLFQAKQNGKELTFNNKIK
jgi:hypothetical protein